MNYKALREIEQPWPVRAECVTGIWVPPSVRLVDDEENGQCVAYWTGYDVAAVLRPDMASHFSGRIQNRPYTDTVTGDPSPLGPENWDWNRKQVREDKLAEDFLNLAYNYDPERVLRFASRYGPLWTCRKHVFCYWDEYRFEYLTSVDPASSPNSFCEWDRREPVSRFQSEARVASGAFEIWQTLKKGRRAPLRLWQTVWSGEGQLGEHAKIVSRQDLSKQQQWLAHIVTKRTSRRVNLTMVWPSSSSPRLVLNTGLGFFPVAWRTIAQRIAGGVSLYTCSGCEQLYFRKDHKPPEGRNNFCPECKDEGKKISKRLWARTSRRKRLEANATSSRKKTTKREV